MTQEKAPQHSVVGQGQANGLDESSGKIVDLQIHHLNLLNDVGVVRLQLPVPAKIGNTLLTSTPSPQPARRLSEEQNATKEHNASRNKLDGKGNEPLIASVGDTLGHAEVDPETNKTANLPAKFVSTNKATTNSRRCDFRDKNWYLVV